MRLAAHCRQILDEAEQRIQKIQVDAAGKPQLAPFEPPAESDESGGDEDVSDAGPGNRL
jgi:hypothetical protein